MGGNIVAVVIPCDDGSTHSVGDELRGTLVPLSSADGYTITDPLRSTKGAHPLGIDVCGTATAVVKPGDDSSTYSIGDNLGILLIVGSGADG
jgi:hypothetical protein